jgi:hypothetical protein
VRPSHPAKIATDIAADINHPITVFASCIFMINPSNIQSLRRDTTAPMLGLSDERGRELEKTRRLADAPGAFFGFLISTFGFVSGLGFWILDLYCSACPDD